MKSSQTFYSANRNRMAVATKPGFHELTAMLPTVQGRAANQGDGVTAALASVT
jgi:hypothetical protein